MQDLCQFQENIDHIVAGCTELANTEYLNRHNKAATYLLDMSIPTRKNTSVKVTEKLSKYKDLEMKVERMWGMKANNSGSDRGPGAN